MYCIKCGADNSETATYCRKCGVLMEAEEETRVASRVDRIDDKMAFPDHGPISHTGEDQNSFSDETEIFSISPTLLFVKIGYAAAALGALFLVAVFSVFTSVSAWSAVLLGFLLFIFPAFYHFKQKLVRYTLTDSKLQIDSGLIARTTRSVPIRRIQDVTVTSGLTQRVLGFGDLVIDNASEEGGKAILKNINTPKHYADVLLRQMRRLDK